MTITFDDLDDGLTSGALAPIDIKVQAHIVNGGDRLFPCPSCGGSGSWRGRGRCFKCNGNGKVSKGVIAAAKGKVTQRENFFAWLGENNDLVTAVRAMSGWSEFAAKMIAIVDHEHRSLSEGQVEACQRMVAKAEAAREARIAARAEAAPTIDISAIVALFATATDNKIKRPVFRAAGVEISKAPMTGKNAGALYVKSEQDVYLGKIADGKFHATREAPADTLAQLQAIAADPTAEAIKYARRTGACGCCGHALVDPVSIIAGIGPICASKWGLDYRRESAREELKAEKEAA